MAVTLFITPAEMTGTTILGGNVDVNKYNMNIAFVQLDTIEPLLGTELYDKIEADFKANTLAGDYLTIFNEYAKPIIKHEAIAEYIEVSNYMVDNAGTFKNTPEHKEIVDKEELQFLAGKYHAMAQMYVKRFEKFISRNHVEEYKTYQDEVNAQKVKTTSGWYFGRGGGATLQENKGITVVDGKTVFNYNL